MFHSSDNQQYKYTHTMNILETRRLILRHQTLSDLDDLFALYCDSDVVKYIPDAPRNYAETRTELEWHVKGVQACLVFTRLFTV